MHGALSRFLYTTGYVFLDWRSFVQDLIFHLFLFEHLSRKVLLGTQHGGHLVLLECNGEWHEFFFSIFLSFIAVLASQSPNNYKKLR